MKRRECHLPLALSRSSLPVEFITVTRAGPYQLRFQLFNSLFKVGELNNVKQQTGQRCSNAPGCGEPFCAT